MKSKKAIKAQVQPVVMLSTLIGLIMPLFGFIDSEKNPPKPLEWVKVPLKKEHFMTMSSGHFCRNGREISSRWYKKTKNGDIIIKEIEYRDILVRQYERDYFLNHQDEMISRMISHSKNIRA